MDWFAVVLRGKVQISQIFSDGSSSLMDALGPGYTLGTDLICTRSRRSPYYAIAAGPLRILRFRRCCWSRGRCRRRGGWFCGGIC